MKIHDKDDLANLTMLLLALLFLIALVIGSSGCTTVSKSYVWSDVECVWVPKYKLEGAGTHKFKDGDKEVELSNKQDDASVLGIGADAAKYIIMKEVNRD